MAKTRKKEIDSELHKIYQNEDGEMPDLRKIQKAREHRLRKILVALVIFFASVAITSWAGFFIFGRQFLGEGVGLEIMAPDEATSGEEIDLVIKYRNRERTTLSAASISVTLPSEFQVISTKPGTAKSGKWDLGALGAASSGEIKIHGKFLSKVGTNELLEALLIYRPANFNAEFERVAKKMIIISNFFLDGTLTGPDKILVGESATYELKVRNTSSETQSNIVLKLLLPASFVISEPPEELTNEKTIKLAALLPNEEKVLKLAGSFSAGETRLENLKVELGFESPLGKFWVGRELVFSSEVVASDLDLKVFLNGEENDAFLNFGDTLSIKVEYKNKGKSILRDVEISLILAGLPEEGGLSPVDFTRITSPIIGKRDGPSITWTKKQIKELASLDPEESGEINLNIGLVDKPFTTTSRDYQVEIVAQAKIGAVSDIEKELVILSKLRRALLLSDVALGAEGRYYTFEGVTLGSGPLPPKSGQTTNYRIFWKLSNTLHEIQDINVSAILPAGVLFTGRTNVGAGDLRYDQVARQVSWTLNRLPLSVAHLESSFEVSIIPTETDRGKIIALLNPITFTARDKFNEGIITLTSAEPITTSLAGDEFGKGKGVVQ